MAGLAQGLLPAMAGYGRLCSGSTAGYGRLWPANVL